MTLGDLGNSDIRTVPAYDLFDAARYVRVPRSTLRDWFAGRDDHGPVLAAASVQPMQLSFFNLIEAHVLRAMRREHRLSLQRIRTALDVLQLEFGTSERPLVDHRFSTDGLDLFVERYGSLVNLSRPERTVLQRVLEQHVRRIVWDEHDLPTSFYPFSTLTFGERERRSISIDPRIAFGRRVIAGTGIRTEIVAERYVAGESIEALALDYARSVEDIEDAIRSEFDVAA